VVEVRHGQDGGPDFAYDVPAQVIFCLLGLEVIERLQAGRIADAAKALETHLRVSRDRAIASVNLIASGSQPDPLPYLDRLTSPRG
jgi:hypothetical protein